jgi:gliding motility-associated lipoprotein GldH
MNKALPIFSILTFVLIIMSACESRDFIFEGKSVFEKSIWNEQDSASYEVNITDTIQLYNLGLVVEHSKNYPAQNLYLKINTTFPNGQYFSQQVNIDFANKAGKWFGDCSGDFCEVEAYIQQGAYFNQSGKYRFTIQQFTRDLDLQDIKSVAFFVEDTQQTRK